MNRYFDPIKIKGGTVKIHVVNETVCLYIKGDYPILDTYMVLNIEDIESLSNLIKEAANQAKVNRYNNAHPEEAP